MPSYNDKHQAQKDMEEIEKKSKNTVKRMLGLRTTLFCVCVCVCGLYLHIIVCGCISDC